MKKLVAVTLAAFTGSFLALALLGLPLRARAGGNPVRETRVPGDTNCDSRLDLSDAVYILNFLFLSTAGSPCPIADPPELVARIVELEADLAMKSTALEGCSAELSAVQADLATCQSALTDCRARIVASTLPDTGQTKCYGLVVGQGWEPGNCADASCPSQTGSRVPATGQDGLYTTGCPSEDRFLENGDGTVIDNCTGLMWQKETADTNGDGLLTDQDRLWWCDGLAYCESLRLASYEDWRLPNIRELQSIVDYGRFNPAIAPVFSASSELYCSSTSGAGIGGAWRVDFASGGVSSSGQYDNDFRVRAVRGP